VRLGVGLVCALVLAGAAAPAASANGDPASDRLPFANVFFSDQNPTSSSAGRALLDVTAQAKKKNFPIRVAVIHQQSDLGLIQSLWRQPQTYATFLGRELIAFGRYHGTLLVAMPQGYGVFGPGAAKGKARLAKMKPGSGSLDNLGVSAADATAAIGAANGVELTVPKTGSGTPAWLIVLGVLAGAAVIAGAVFFGLRRWLLAP
jgi:LPXTG-motif cell wall-anchored protein